ncbi:MAG TPA: Ig-like domain-containing protein [Pseudomonadota bacterium]|nr:Ig-like domain-containing protein [Pseudomonadota bacterium]
MKPSELVSRTKTPGPGLLILRLRLKLRAAVALSVAAVALVAGCGQPAAPKVDSIAVTASSMDALPKGTTRQYAALAHYTDNTTVDVSSLVVWKAEGSIVTVSNETGSRGLVTAVAFGQTVLSATYSDVTGTANISVAAATLKSILVAPQSASLANGTTVQLSATAVYSDLTTVDVTQMVTWKSASAAIATVSSSGGTSGLLTGVSPGPVEITASLAGVDGKTTVVVTNATLRQLAVTPTAPTLAKGTTVQLVATGTFSDNTTQDVTSLATWTTAGAAVATVSNQSGSRGLTTGVSKGLVAIQAALSGQTGSANLTVTDATLSSLTVTPTGPVIASGTAMQLIATGNFSDGTAQNLTTSVTWSSSVPSVATVSNTAGAQGLASGLTRGQTSITATLSGRTGSTPLTVTDAVLTSIAVTPATQSLAAGTNLQFIATGTYSDNTNQDITSLVSWTSSNVNFATISSGAGTRGLARGVAPGTVTITAVLGTVAGTAMLTVNNATLSSIAVTPATQVIAAGTSLQLVATGTYSNGTTANLTTQVTWSSSIPATATVSNAAGSLGLASALARGTTTITATLGTVSGSTTLVVSNATLSSIEMQPASATIARGNNLQLSAIGHYSDNSTQNLTSLVTWTSSDPTVATVSSAAGSNGLSRGVQAGGVTITATLSGVTGTANLMVTNATLGSISVTPATQVIAKGTTLQFIATGIYSDGTTADISTQVTWGSSSGGVVTISNAAGTIGLASAAAKGTATITATLLTVSGSTTLGVSDATLTSISVTPTTPSVPHGMAQQFVATGRYSDNSTQDISSLATWSSSDMAVASISNTAGSRGLASTSLVGSTTITASLGGVNGSTVLAVTPANLVSISVTPAARIIARGTTQQFTATGIYSDGSSMNLTTAVTWTSSGPAATISNVDGSRGLATGAVMGTVTIGAVLDAVSGSTTLGITNATLMSISVTSANMSVAKGTTEQFTATGIYSDATNQDITSLVTWSSSMTAVATISSSTGSRGLATAVAPGTTSITATLGAVSGSRDLIVTSATLSSIVITPGGSFLARGTQQFFTATGIYSDTTQRDLTTMVSWSSSDPTIATVDNSTGAKGLVTAVAAGSANITATDTMSGKSGTTRVTVTNAVLMSIAITPANPSIAKGTTVQLTATGTYNDGRKQDLTTLVTWSTSTTNVSVSNTAGSEGLAFGGDVSTATITAQLSGMTGTTMLTVTAATLVSLSLSPGNTSLPLGYTRQYKATGTYSDGSMQVLTSDSMLTWASSNTAVATISNADGFEGLVTSVDTGDTVISATIGTISISAMLTVTSATLMSIAVSPDVVTIARGSLQRFTATGTFDDGSTLDLTTQVAWSSSSTAISIDPASGVATAGPAADTATITATIGGYMATSDVTIS